MLGVVLLPVAPGIDPTVSKVPEEVGSRVVLGANGLGTGRGSRIRLLLLDMDEVS